jgi:hypothetical protein
MAEMCFQEVLSAMKVMTCKAFFKYFGLSSGIATTKGGGEDVWKLSAVQHAVHTSGVHLVEEAVSQIKVTTLFNCQVRATFAFRVHIAPFPTQNWGRPLDSYKDTSIGTMTSYVCLSVGKVKQCPLG